MKNYSDFGIYDFSDYAEELIGEALIRVNGGSCGGGFSGGGAGGGTGGGSGTTGAGSSGGTSSGTGTSSGGNRGGSSGGTSGGSSSGSGSCGGGSSSSASSPSSGHSGTSGTGNTGSQTTGTTGTTSSGSSCGGSSGGTSGSTTAGKTNTGTSGYSSGYGYCGGASSTNNAKSKINNSIKENSDKKYNENGNGYKCDNWVEEVLTDAGYDSGKYLTAGKASEKTVQDHINALESSGNKYSKTIPTKEGVYVVFMNGTGSLGTLDPHCGILNVSASGAMTFTHNSSANANKGIESWSVESQNNGTKLSQLAYSSFYFQEIK